MMAHSGAPRRLPRKPVEDVGIPSCTLSYRTTGTITDWFWYPGPVPVYRSVLAVFY